MNLPKLGQYAAGMGGLSAGIAPGGNGHPDYLLFCAPLEGMGTYAEALAAAKEHTADGHHDFDGATIVESALCFATCRMHFVRDWYWTKEHYVDDPGYGWIQSFDFGYLSWDPLGDRNRFFAVRRVPL